jgi:outer membrane protein assembly factor BamE (lipoprotein component of BamABCDE complex)
MIRFPLNKPAVLLFCLTLAACTPTLVVQGYVPDDETLATVQQGVDSKDAVVTKLGSPSSIAAFDDDTWIYINKSTENFAFFEPTVVGQNVVAINFDPEGRVENIRRYTLEDGRLIDPITRKTPTQGRELGILEQLFGNVGRFNTGTDGGPQ